MIACSRCGHTNPDTTGTCGHCGDELDSRAAQALLGTSVLGVYEITDVLGQGGMSVVYRARHRMTEQQVALKILPPELAAHSTLKARLLEEAKALAKLEHPNIVHLYNFGEEKGRFVLAMQYVEGQTFERMILKRTRVPWGESVRVITQVLSALEYAHGRGVIHRDIKPSNILVREDLSVCVMDFGIAKMTESTRLTATGQTMGTVRYMSPEQVHGGTLDQRSDLYSTGVTLYEAILGDTPFGGDTHFEIMSKHLNQQPPRLRPILQARGEDIPEALESAILRSLEKNRAVRFGTAREFREALDALTPAQGPPARLAEPSTNGGANHVSEPFARSLVPLPRLSSTVSPPRSSTVRRRTNLWVLSAALIVAAGAGIVLFVEVGGRPTGTTVDAGIVLNPLGGGWKDPPRLPGRNVMVDQKFEGLRVLVVRSAPQAWVSQLAETYVRAQSEFVAWARSHVAAWGARKEGRLRPVNLFLIPPNDMCIPEVHAPGPVPDDCAALPYQYELDTATLFVPDPESKTGSDALLQQRIREGAAMHVCFSTPELATGPDDGCVGLLHGYFADRDANE